MRCNRFANNRLLFSAGPQCPHAGDAEDCTVMLGIEAELSARCVRGPSVEPATCNTGRPYDCAVPQGENTDYCQAHGRALKEGAPGAQPALGCKGGT